MPHVHGWEHGHPSQQSKGRKNYRMVTCQDTPTSSSSNSIYVYQHFVPLLSIALAHVTYHSEQKNWPASKVELITKHRKVFSEFIEFIDFDLLQKSDT